MGRKYFYCPNCGEFYYENDNDVTDKVAYLLEKEEFMTKEEIDSALENQKTCGCND